MSLPEDERRWFEAERKKLEARELRSREEARARRKLLADEAARMIRQCPALWAKMRETFHPAVHAGAKPASGVSFGEMCAWRQGEHNVIRWIERLAQEAEQ